MKPRARIRILAALIAAACASDPTGGGDLLVVSQIDVQPPSASIALGATQQLTATPKTSSGITVPNRTVTWSSSDQGIATISASGLVTGVAVGVSTITARVDDVSADVVVNITPKPVSSVTVEPPQVSLQVGGAQQLQATARDAQGQPLQDRPITFQSDNPAVASVSTTGLVVAVTPGSTTARATSEGRTGTSAITVTPRPASRLSFVTHPANGTAAQALGPVRVAVQDEIGGTILDATTSITMSIADNPGGATLGGTVTVNAVSGIATFGNLLLDKAGSGYTLRASAAPLSPALSNPFAITVGSAAKLAVTTQPSAAAQSGIQLPGQPVVQITDAGGNAVSQAGVAITAQLVGAGATLGGGVTVSTGANGSAAFSNLMLTGIAGNYSLQFTAAGYTDAVSNTIALTAGTATGLFLLTPPSATAENGEPFPQQPVVQLRDGNNNPVAQPGVPVTALAATGGGVLTGPTVVNTGADGRAVYTGLVLSGAAGTHTLTFSAPNLGQIESPPITLAPGSATRLQIVTQPSASASNGSPFAVQPSIQVVDAGGNPIPQLGVVVTAALPAGPAATSGLVTATTNASGRAVFTTLAITGTVGTYQILFSAPGYSSAQSTDIVLGAGAASQLIFLTQPAGAANAVPLTQQPALQLTDLSGNLVATAGVVITAALNSGPGTLGGILTATTNASGIAQFTNLTLTGTAALYTFAFSGPGLTPVISDPIGLGAGFASKLTFTTQPSASAGSGAAFAQQPVLQLRDASDNPVSQAGVIVTASIFSGGGALVGTVTATTDATGAASFTNLGISGIVGNRTLRFSSPGLTPATSNTIAVTAGAPTRLVVTVQPSPTAASGTPFPQQPAVRVQDAAGNNVTGLASFPVTAAIASGSGATLGGTTVVATDANGIATFTNLALTGTSGNFTLSFSGGGYTAAVSNTIALGAGAASKLAIATQPSPSVQSGQVFPQQPVIQLQDASSNPVPQAGVVVTVTIQSGNPALGGTLNATTNASGIATFTNLAITGLIGNRTLIFAAGGLVSATSNTIVVTAGAAAAILMTTQPSAAAQSGVAFPQQPAVHLVDQSGNAVSQAGVNITTSIASGGGALGGTATAATNGSGVATFTNLSISGAPGVRTLAFNSGALTGATSSSITLSTGPASKLAIATQPGGPATNGSALPTQPQVQLQDGAGNAVSQAGVLITAVIGAGSPAGALTSATATTNGSGLATFSGLTITGLVGTYRLQFTSGGLTATPLSSGILLGASGATALSITTPPSSGAQSGTAIPTQPAIQLRDQSGNAVSSAGVTITAAIATDPGGSPSLTNATANTNGSGLATFAGLAITGTAGGYTLQFSSGALTPVTSGTITLGAGSATALEMFTEPSANAQSGAAFATQPVVRARDAGDNNVSGALVTASIASGPGGATLGGTLTATTAANGRATFSGLFITGPAGSYTLQFTTPGATPATSQTITLGAGAASKLAITTQPGGPATNGSALPTQPQVQLQDGAGNAVSQAGVLITAVIGAGSPAGALTSATATTNGSGLATFSGLTITGLVGTYRLQFTSGGLTATPLSSGILLGASGATALSITTPPSSGAQSGTAIPTQPAIQLRDQSGNAVSSAGVTITAAIATDPGGSPSLTNATANTNGSGLATFAGLAITGTAGGYTLQFSSGALTPVTSGTITLGAGSATALEMFTEPSANAQSGAAFATQPVVRARDAGNNNVSGALVTASIASGPGGATLGGTLTATTAANGRATFSGLFITGPAGSYTLQFTTPGATPATSQTITLSAGAPSKLAITTQPSGAVRNDQAFPTQPVIQVQDAAGNPVADGGLVVTAVIASGGGVLGPLPAPVTATTNGSGVASFAGVKITGTIGIRTLSFSAPSRTGVTSSNVVVSAGTATQIVMVTQPPASVQSGATLVPNPVVDLRDISNNNVDSAGVSIAVDIVSGGAGTLGGTSPRTTAGNGQATFNDLTITGTTGNRTLEFTNAGLTTATSNVVNVTAGPATTLTITQQPSANATNDVALAQQPIVQVTDGGGNPVVSTNVTVSLLGGGTLSGGLLTVATDGAGNANFSGLKIVGLAGTKNLHFTSGALSDDSDDITLSAGAATQMVITVQPPAAATENTLFAPPPTVVLRDSGGNQLTTSGTDIVAELVVESGTGTLGGTLTVATVSGESAFADLLITTAGTYRIKFTSGGLSVTSAQIVVSP